MINVTDLKTAWGAHYIAGGQGVKDIMKAILVPSVTDAEWAGTITPTEDTQVRKMKSSLTSVLQPFQKGASPAGDATIEPLSKDLTKMKYETDIDPDTIENSYAGFLATLDDNDRKKWPITKWIVTEMIAKGAEDWELSVVYGGVYSAPTPGTAGAVGTTHDGIGTQIAADITATNITPVNGPAAWSTDPDAFLEEFETWIQDVKDVSEVNRHIVENKVDKVFMSKTHAELLARGIFRKYNINYNASGQSIQGQPVKFPLPFSNLTIVGLPSMSGSNRVIMTPKENRMGYIKRPNAAKAAQLFETGPRELLAFCDFWKQVSYWDPAYMYVNQLA